jgi:hypothetical protein
MSLALSNVADECLHRHTLVSVFHRFFNIVVPDGEYHGLDNARCISVLEACRHAKVFDQFNHHTMESSMSVEPDARAVAVESD